MISTTLWMVVLVLSVDLVTSTETLIEPEFVDSLDNLTIVEGRDAVISCSISNLNEHTVGWVKADTKAIQAIGKNIVTHNPRISVDHPFGSNQWKLIIRNVQTEDAGFYMAQINTVPMKSRMAHLTVMQPPNIDDHFTPSHKQVKENESVVLECRARGQPPPAITWKREDGTSVVQKGPCRDARRKDAFTAGAGYGRLCIAPANRLDMGAYFCIASNGVPPSVSKRIHLAVLFPAIVRAEKSLVGATLGGRTSLECRVEASPQPNHFWHKGNQTIGKTERYVIDARKTDAYTVIMVLNIVDVVQEDIGLYRCQAGNSESTIRLYESPPTLLTTSTTVASPRWQLLHSTVRPAHWTTVKTAATVTPTQRQKIEKTAVEKRPAARNGERCIAISYTTALLLLAQGFLLQLLFD